MPIVTMASLNQYFHLEYFYIHVIGNFQFYNMSTHSLDMQYMISKHDYTESYCYVTGWPGLAVMNREAHFIYSALNISLHNESLL